MRVVLTSIVAFAGLSLPALSSERIASGEIVFERRTGTGLGELYVVRPDGTGLRRLGAGRADFDPAPSPDGERIVFASDRSGGSGAHELFVIHRDGTGLRRLTRRVQTGAAWTADSAPAWSPDGRRIVFVRLEVRGSTSQSDLWIVDANGSGLRALTRTPGSEAAPHWHGRGIHYERDGSIYRAVVAPRGRFAGRPQRVRRGTEPAVSEAGGSLVFVRDGAVYVTRGGRALRLAQGSSPTWAPDGSRIVYSAADGLFSVAPDGKGRRRLTRPPRLVHDLAPAWRP